MRWRARLLAVASLVGAGAMFVAALADGVGSREADAKAGAIAATPATRHVVLSMERSRRVIVASCSRRSISAQAAVRFRRGDTLFVLPKGETKRVIDVPSCASPAGATLRPSGTDEPPVTGRHAAQVIALPEGSRATAVVIPRCPADHRPPPGLILLTRTDVVGRIAVVPEC